MSGSSWLPKWTGELYLEYHRGTYTSMARNKRYNRKAEFATQDTEFLAVCDGLISGAAYPREELDSVWEAVLRNQFHDILPGSSIKEVYNDSKEEYEKLLAVDSRLMEASLKRLVSAIDAPEGALAVYNFGPEVKAEVVEFYYEGGWPVVYDGERKVSVQKSGERTYIFTASGLPERGYKTYGLGESEVGDGSKGNPMFSVSEHHLENRYFSIRLNSKGQFAGILDKTAGRELLMPGKSGNVIMSYEDRPHNYDAWDINNYYEEKSWEVDQVECIEVTEHGPVRACVTVTRRYLDSTIKQSIYLYHDIPRIDIRNQIDDLEIVRLDWDSLIPAVTTGKVDCVIAGQSITSERLQAVDFTEPYYYATIVTLVKEGSKYADAKSVADLAGATCTSQQSTIWYNTCLPQIEGANILAATASAPDMLMSLNADKCDLVVTDQPTGKGALVAYPNFKMLEFGGGADDFQVTEEDINIGISLKKGNTELQEAIDSVLSKMTKDDFSSMMDEAISVQPLAN